VQPTLWTRRACGAAFVDQEEAAVSARDLSHVLGSLRFHLLSPAPMFPISLSSPSDVPLLLNPTSGALGGRRGGSGGRRCQVQGQAPCSAAAGCAQAAAGSSFCESV
jgi:hypothetical protein